MKVMATFNAGHAIGIDPGAVSPVRPEYGDYIYTEEARYTLEIANLTNQIWEEELKQRGIVVQNDSLQKVCDISNENKSHVFVSIHANSFSGISAQGIETLYFSEAGKEIAGKLQNEMIYRLQRVNRGIKYRSDLHVLKGTFAPAILVEAGFISNPEEEQEMNTESFKRNLAIAICNGLALYFGIEPFGG